MPFNKKKSASDYYEISGDNNLLTVVCVQYNRGKL